MLLGWVQVQQIEGTQASDLLAEKRFEPFEVFIGFGEFTLGVAEDVLHGNLRVFLKHVHRERSRVLAPGNADDVADRWIVNML